MENREKFLQVQLCLLQHLTCKEYISNYRKWLRKLYVYSTNINMSDEDNNHDTNYINKHKDANHDTRKLHLWARHVERAVSVLSWCCVIHTSLAQDVLESSLHPIFMHERLSLTSPSSLSTSTCPSPSSSTPLSWCTLSRTPNLDNLNTVQHNLRHSAKGSNDAYNVTDSLTEVGCCCRWEKSSGYTHETIAGTHWSRCSLMHTEDKSITLQEKVCRPVCRCRQCLRIERGNPLWTVTKCHDRTGQPVVEGHEQIRTLLDRQREQVLADCQAEIRTHKFQAKYDRRSFQKLGETIESQQENFIVLKQKNAMDKINNFFMNSNWSKIGIFVKFMKTVSKTWKNWRSFRVLPSTQLREEDESKTEILFQNLLAR